MKIYWDNYQTWVGLKNHNYYNLFSSTTTRSLSYILYIYKFDIDWIMMPCAYPYIVQTHRILAPPYVLPITSQFMSKSYIMYYNITVNVYYTKINTFICERIWEWRSINGKGHEQLRFDEVQVQVNSIKTLSFRLCFLESKKSQETKWRLSTTQNIHPGRSTWWTLVT